jgi:thiamine biosynthesis lipoprotein
MIGRLAVLWLLGAGLATAPAGEPQLTCFRFARTEMAAPVRITLYASEAGTANAAAEAAFARIHQLNGIFSDYDPQSEVRRLCDTAGQGKNVRVSEELWRVLVHSDTLAEQSGGAFDVTVGPVVLLWRQARRTGQLPPPETLSEALKLVGHHLIRFDPQRRSVELLKPGMQLDFGGIAKGYAVDEALTVLRQHGFTHAMVVAGGEIGLGDPPPNKPGWLIGIAPLELDAPPKHRLWLSRVSVSTSGDAWQYVEIGGRRYSHIVDPRTGMGLTDHSSVTIIAPDGITADGMAKVVSVLGPEKGLSMVDQTPDMAALIVRAPEGKSRTYQSRRWERFSAAPPPAK